MRRAFDLTMRFVTSLLGLLMIGMGSIWMMQGLGRGPAAIMQGFMVNDIRWTYLRRDLGGGRCRRDRLGRHAQQELTADGHSAGRR